MQILTHIIITILINTITTCLSISSHILNHNTRTISKYIQASSKLAISIISRCLKTITIPRKFKITRIKFISSNSHKTITTLLKFKIIRVKCTIRAISSRIISNTNSRPIINIIPLTSKATSSINSRTTNFISIRNTILFILIAILNL